MTSDASTPKLDTATQPWAESGEATVLRLDSSPTQGLSEREARDRLQKFGPNRLREVRARSVWRILDDQFKSLIVVLLIVAAGAAFAFEEFIEGVAIGAVILINAGIGFFTERHAMRSMEALRRLGHTRSTVLRDGSPRSITADLLVPGDIVLLDAGDVLSADLRILSASRLQADESALTGESLPIRKSTDAVARETALAERSSMLFKGTAVTRGSGTGIVVATGMSTVLGDISSLVDEAESEVTPLEKRLDRLGRRLIVLTLVIAVIVAVAFIASGRGVFLAIEIGIALAVASFPEGLPIVATVALARGMWRMARRHALIQQLAAVETLGSTTLILTDKTGTLTENRMTVVELRSARYRIEVSGSGLETRGELRSDGEPIDVADTPELLEALRVAVLCNNASLARNADGQVQVTGDPTEVALLVLGAKAGLERDALQAEWPELREIAFDPDTKRMATLHAHGERTIAAVKGAPEVLLGLCTRVRSGGDSVALSEPERRRWLQDADEMASHGHRILALATRDVGAVDDFAFEDLELLGLVAFLDPPRKTVRSAIDACQAAGIDVVMVTGDHGATGFTVAAAVGLIDPRPGDRVHFVDGRKLPAFEDLSKEQADELLDAAVIARASPKQKLELIALHQERGAVVAMTGDGVNDAPALKKADIGVAMGQRGTEVAREAADMVLEDDEFGTIVEAVAQGRAIFSNLRKFVVYLLSCNVSEILTVGLGVLAQGLLPLPLLPLQILFLNLVTDVFPALALGVCEGSPAAMRQPPRDPREPILTKQHWWTISLLGGVIAISVLSALFAAVFWLELPEAEATSVAFLTLALAQLWHVFSMRSRDSHWLRNEVTANSWVWGALALCVLLLLVAVYWSPLAAVLSLADPGTSGWTVALGASLVPLLVGQLMLLLGPGLAERSEASHEELS